MVASQHRRRFGEPLNLSLTPIHTTPVADAIC